MTTKRICKLCGAFLSSYNKYDVCWCHKEHPDKKHLGERDWTPPKGAGHDTPMLNITIMNEYGPSGFHY